MIFCSMKYIYSRREERRKKNIYEAMYTGRRKMRGYTRETAGRFERGSRKHRNS